MKILWTVKDKEIQELVKSLYKDSAGNPIILTWGQVQIFRAIAMKEKPRWYCSCFTRYGKSLVVALAVLTRIATYSEKWSIVSGTTGKAKIIMNYVNEHIFDNEYTASKFRLTSGETAESIKRHRNKSHITFDLGGGKMSELFITTGKQAIGLGSPNVIEDEASLIPDDEQALIQRMIGDNPDDNFLFKIGNPFYRNHFYRSSIDPLYEKIVIDYQHGIMEGRITQSIIDENSKFSYFNVLYKCEFPSAESIDESGWSYLVNDQDLQNCLSRFQTGVVGVGKPILGVDVARGGRNFNAWVIRQGNVARVLKKDLDNDLMSVAGKTIELMKQHNVVAENVFIDDVGVGGGVVDRIKELGYAINPVKEGGRADKNEEYINIKAEMYAGQNGLAMWMKQGGALEPNEGWSELTRIRFKKDSTGRTKMESKEDMRKRGEESPDIADALSLTFVQVLAKKMFYAPDPAMILGKGADDFA